MEEKEKQPCWLARLYKAMKRRHWDSGEETISDNQVLMQAAIVLTIINVVTLFIKVGQVTR